MELKELGLQDLQIDFSNNAVHLSPLYAKEGDVGTRGIRLQVLANGVVVDTTGISATLYATTSKNLDPYELVFTEIDLTKGMYEVVYTTNMLVSGIVYLEIVLRDTIKNQKLSYKKMKLLVDAGLITDSAIEGSDSYPLFEKLLEAGENEVARIANEDIRKANEVARINAENERGIRLGELEVDLTAHKEDYANLNIGNRLTDLENAKIKKYGVRRAIGATTPVLERLGDAVGKVANVDTDLTKHNVVQNDFDKIYPWSHMRKCIIDSTGRITYEGEAGYTTAIGDWMIEIPEFYWKRTNDGVILEEWVSPYPVGGYIKSNKFYIARFKTSEVDNIHVSRPNSFPRVVLGRAGFRAKAIEKGVGWQLEDLLGNYILNLLYRVEFAHLNSQLILGNGVTSVRYTEDDLVQIAEDNTNRVVLLTANANNYNVGEAISIGTSRGNMAGGQYRTILSINDLGNGTKELVFDGTPISVLSTYKVYMAGQISGKTLDMLASSGTAIGVNNRSSITYRGIEDIFGNVLEWIDGTLINDHRGYVCLDPSKYTDTITTDFKPLSYENAKSNNYAGELGFDSNYPFAEFTVDVTGGSATKYCDYYYQGIGLRAPSVGGDFYYGVVAGLRYWHCNNSPAGADIYFGSRLLKK